MKFQKNNVQHNENPIRVLIARYLPFWPLFLILVATALIAAWIYLKMATPIYQASATLIIRDENKGVDESNMSTTFNPFDSKKIVENEIEVINSRALMTEVVKNLYLYAPIAEERTFKTVSGYSTSPLHVELRNPNRIPLISADDPIEYVFTYNSTKKKVVVNDKEYPVNEWFNGGPFGEMRFVPTENGGHDPEATFFYSFVNPKIAASSISSRLEVYSSNKLSTVVNMDYRDEDPQRAENILNQLIKEYDKKGLDALNDLAENTLSFIDDRMLEVEKELDNLEKDIERFRTSKGVVDLSEQGKLYLQNVGEYDRQISDITRQLNILNRIEKYVVSKTGQSGIIASTSGIENPVLAQLVEKLYNSEIEYEKLKKTTGENNPILQSLINEIQEIRPRILNNIRNQKSNLSSSLGSLNASSDSSNEALKTIPESERALIEITRKQKSKSDLFQLLQEKREETALTFAPTNVYGRVVDMAEASLEPVSPKSMFVYFGAFILALVAGIGYVTVKELLNNKILFRTEIEEYTEVPVVGELPYIKNETGVESAVASDPIILEQFRQLCSNLDLYSRNYNDRKILVTSSIAGEGKSFISTNLAHSIAKAGKRVILLDMDFIKPNTSKIFGLSSKMGLINYLKGDVDIKDIIVNPSDNSNLSVIPAGQTSMDLNGIATNGTDHTSLLLNGKLDLFFEKLSKAYDYVIIDSAPIDLVSNVNILTEFSDKTLLVIRHAHTPRQILKKLERNEDENMAIVFNGVKNRGIMNGYGYGYGYGYGEYYMAQ